MNTELKSRDLATEKRLLQKNRKNNLLKRSLQSINANHCLKCHRQFS